MLNVIWPLFIIASFVYAIFTGHVEKANNAMFEGTTNAIQLTISLIGTMCLWSGIMKIASKTSIIEKLTKALAPIMKRLFPDIKKDDTVHRQISMNIIANIMGMGNAATPMGLKAMETLQNKNKNKDVLSNSMIMLIVLNTASIQIIPTTVIGIRTSLRITKPNGNDYTSMDYNNMCSCLYYYCFKDINEKILTILNDWRKN